MASRLRLLSISHYCHFYQHQIFLSFKSSASTRTSISTRSSETRRGRGGAFAPRTALSILD